MNWSKLIASAFFLAIGMLSQESSAQMEIQKGIEGKTFYDSAKQQVHEAYEYKIRYRMVIDPRTGNAVPVADPEEVKNGVYIRYREDGTIECTGYYKNDVACGTWQYMDSTGKVVIREEVIEGACVTGG